MDQQYFKIGDIVYQHFCGGTTIGRIVKLNKASVKIEVPKNDPCEVLFTNLKRVHILSESERTQPYFAKLLRHHGLDS